MAYCISTDIINALSAVTVAELTDDSQGTTIDNTVLSAKIAEADAFINTYLRSQHTVPISPVPESVKMFSIHITSKFLFDRRTQAEDSQVEANYETALEKLKKIAHHELTIDDSESVANTGGFYRTNKIATDKVYTDTELDKFI